jgi:hypothetical protein
VLLLLSEPITISVFVETAEGANVSTQRSMHFHYEAEDHVYFLLCVIDQVYNVDPS